MLTHRDLQNIRLAMYTKNDSYYTGENMHCDIIDIVDELIGVRELLDIDAPAPEQMENIMERLEKLTGKTNYLDIIRENKNGHTVEEWREIIKENQIISPVNKEFLLGILSDVDVSSALAVDGDIDDID